MSSDIAAETETTPEPAPAPRKGRGVSVKWFTLIGGAVVLNILAFIFFPPFPRGGEAGQPCAFPACFINGTLEFPAPHVVWDLDPATAPSAGQLVTFHPSITSTILTMWIVIVIVLVAAVVMARGRKLIRDAGRTCSSGSTRP